MSEPVIEVPDYTPVVLMAQSDAIRTAAAQLKDMSDALYEQDQDLWAGTGFARCRMCRVARLYPTQDCPRCMGAGYVVTAETSTP